MLMEGNITRIVPFWFKKKGKIKQLCQKWRFLAKSGYYYDIDMATSKIIET